MLMADARTGVQVAAAEGSARKADLALGGFLYGGGAGGGLGGYASTDEGKVIAASLVDNYNNIVLAVRGQPSLHRDVGSLVDEAAAGGAASSGPERLSRSCTSASASRTERQSDSTDSAIVVSGGAIAAARKPLARGNMWAQ